MFVTSTHFDPLLQKQVPKAVVGCERRIEVKFNDDADDNGRTPARPLPARYVVPLPEGFDEEEGKVEEEDGDVAGAVGGSSAGGGGAAGGAGTGGGGGGAVGGGEEDAEEPMGEHREFFFFLYQRYLRMYGVPGITQQIKHSGW